MEILSILYDSTIILFATVYAFIIVVVAIVGAVLVAFSPFLVLGAVSWGVYKFVIGRNTT